MKKILLLIVLFSLLLLCACSNTIDCDCCGSSVDWDDSFILTGCSETVGRGYTKSIAFRECALCESCYRDAMHELVDNLAGSILEEYLLEHLVDNFSGSNLEQFLIDQGYSVKFIG